MELSQWLGGLGCGQHVPICWLFLLLLFPAEDYIQAVIFYPYDSGINDLSGEFFSRKDSEQIYRSQPLCYSL